MINSHCLNWINNLTNDLKSELDWYYSHYPCKYIIIPEQSIKKKNMTLEYKWESFSVNREKHLDLSQSDYNTNTLVLITIDIKDKNCKEYTRLLDELAFFLKGRSELLSKKDYIVVIKDKERFDIDDEHSINGVLWRFDNLIDQCENNKIALKMFYSQYQKNELIFKERQIYVNAWWVK